LNHKDYGRNQARQDGHKPGDSREIHAAILSAGADNSLFEGCEFRKMR
jgi:hypothetical protein